jgi:hypothetical protein
MPTETILGRVEAPTLYCASCMTPRDRARQGCGGCYSYSGQWVTEIDRAVRNAWLTRRTLAMLIAKLPTLDERDERGIGSVWSSPSPLYGYPWIVLRHGTHYRRAQFGDRQICGFSAWSYHVECLGCGETESASSCSSVTAEDAPGYFGRKHAHCHP